MSGAGLPLNQRLRATDGSSLWSGESRQFWLAAVYDARTHPFIGCG
jgi:hypothetical protein